jgi:hypothetical protein
MIKLTKKQRKETFYWFIQGMIEGKEQYGIPDDLFGKWVIEAWKEIEGMKE